MVHILFSALLSVMFIAGSAKGDALQELGRIPVQDDGRVKPFDTYARENLRLIFGKETFNGKPAVEVVTTWFLIPEHWTGIPIVQLRRMALKDALKLESNKDYFSIQEISHSERLNLVFQDLDNRLQMKEKLNPYYQDVQRLRNQLGTFQAITMGQAVRLVPPLEGDRWLSIPELTGEPRSRFTEIAQAVPIAIKGDSSALKKPVDDFLVAARAANPTQYADATKIGVELHYNSFHPFQKAWIAYLACVLLILLHWIGPARIPAYGFAWAALIVGFLLHTYGFAIRIYLAGRPPVSNMYETVVWVPFGAVIFGMIIETIYKKRYAIFSAGVVGTLCLIIADLAPAVLDSSIQPLEPVLRSNLWLTIHVMTITLSYAAFFLALILGDLGVFFSLRASAKTHVADLALATYRVLQIGVVLLAAGTILGGVWADYSWGRFWGWDPKETWAFIALLGYLALLHARRGGYVRDFGLFVGSIVSFSLVVMAWYGVNFVLGAGLHSYGFGGGGLPFVATFVGAHLTFSAFAVTVHRSRKTKAQTS